VLAEPLLPPCTALMLPSTQAANHRQRKQNPKSCPAAQDADELFDAFKCIETLLIQRRSQMAAWSSLSAVASTTSDGPTTDKVCGVTLWLVVWVRSGI